MRVHVALAWMAVATVALSAPAQAQGSLPCDAFVKFDEGAWQATRNVAVPGPGRFFNVVQGAVFRAGGTIMGMDLAAQLDQECPTVAAPVVPAPGAASVPAALPGVASGGQPQTQLSRYADADGNIDVQKLTCAQLADASPIDADFIGAWYSGWSNGRAKKQMLNVSRVRAGTRDLVAYCKANRDKRMAEAIDTLMKQARR